MKERTEKGRKMKRRSAVTERVCLGVGKTGMGRRGLTSSFAAARVSGGV